VLKVKLGTGETRLRSLVSKDRTNKPMVKSNGAQRESDGVVVRGTAHKGVERRKGPDFGHAGGGSKREGMAGTARPNNLNGHPPVDKVRKLQRQLWMAAKRSPGRRFHTRPVRPDLQE
jgi:RNA-directed DNA polymerase